MVVNNKLWLTILFSIGVWFFASAFFVIFGSSVLLDYVIYHLDGDCLRSLFNNSFRYGTKKTVIKGIFILLITVTSLKEVKKTAQIKN